MITNGMNKIDVMTESQIPLIKKLFKSDIENFLQISHFSIILITEDRQAYITSASQEFSNSFFKYGYHRYDNTLCPLMYENLDFYTWAEGYMKINQKQICAIKKEYRLNNGTVFVRRIGEYVLLYCVATIKEDPIMKTIFVNHANSILQLGDYCYNELIIDFNEHFNGIALPKIQTFKPFLDRTIPCLTSYESSRKSEMMKVIESTDIATIRSNLRLIVNNSK